MGIMEDQSVSVGAASAPSGTDIMRRIMERDENSVQLAINSAVVMLVDRYDEALRRELYAYVDACPHEDLYQTGTLIVQRGHDPNIIRAMLNTIDFYKSVLDNCGWENASKPTDFLTVEYSELGLNKKDSLTSRDYGMLKAAHLFYVARVNPESEQEVKLVADRIKDVEPAIPVIMALALLNTRNAPTTSEVLEIARYIKANLKDIERIKASVADRNGFDPEFLDIMLTKDMGALDSGTL